MFVCFRMFFVVWMFVRFRMFVLYGCLCVCVCRLGVFCWVVLDGMDKFLFWEMMICFTFAFVFCGFAVF